MKRDVMEWISLKDKLPKSGQSVFLIDAETGYAYVAWMNKPNEWYYFTCFGEKEKVEKDPTHWMLIERPNS